MILSNFVNYDIININDEYHDVYKKMCALNIFINYYCIIYFLFFQRITAAFSENGFSGCFIYYNYCVKYTNNVNSNTVNLVKISPKFIFRHEKYSSPLSYSCGNTYNKLENNIYIMYGSSNYKTGVCIIPENIMNDFCETNDCAIYIYDNKTSKFIDCINFFNESFYDNI